MLTRDRAHVRRPNPYRRREPIFAANPIGNAIGVKVIEVAEDSTPFRTVYDPHHVDAVDGYVRYPNINVVQEMVDMLMASRSYEANVTAMDATKSMFSAAMRIVA